MKVKSSCEPLEKSMDIEEIDQLLQEIDMELGVVSDATHDQDDEEIDQLLRQIDLELGVVGDATHDKDDFLQGNWPFTTVSAQQPSRVCSPRASLTSKHPGGTRNCPGERVIAGEEGRVDSGSRETLQAGIIVAHEERKTQQVDGSGQLEPPQRFAGSSPSLIRPGRGMTHVSLGELSHPDSGDQCREAEGATICYLIGILCNAAYLT